MPTQFTIAIPTHNRRETVLLAAQSALAQSRPPLEVLLLCDGCDDGTADAARALESSRIEVLELPKAPGYAYEHRNRSLERARGEAILWLADDDLLTPDHLERIGELWDTGRFDLVQSHCVLVHPDDQLEWFGLDWSLPENRARLALSNSNPMSSVSVRVDLARAIGGWDVGIERAADWDLWRRALAAGARSANSPEPTVLHFRASGREQAWRLRVRQNAAWLQRLEDPEHQLELRSSLWRAEAQREADMARQWTELEQYARGLQELARAAEQRTHELEQHAGSLQRALDTTRRELEQTQQRAAQLAAYRATAESAAALHAQTLQQIYDGGWWRLRRKLLPVMRLLGRGG